MPAVAFHTEWEMERCDLLIIIRRLWANLLSSVDHAVHWRSHLTAKEVNWFTGRRCEANINKLILTMPVLIFVLGISALWRAFARGVSAVPWEGVATAIAIAIALVVLLVSLSLVRRSVKRPIAVQLPTRFLYGAWLLVACSVAALWAVRIQADPGADAIFYILIVAIAALPTLTIVEAGALYGACTLIALFAMAYARAPVIHYARYIALLAVSLFFSQLFFYNYMAMQIGRLRLQVSSESDTLTGLKNRRGLMNWLNEHRALIDNRASRVACGFLDIDKFKMYNDTFGHIEGDTCLKAVSGAIAAYFEEHSAAVCRFGGEEIVVIAIGVTQEQAKEHYQNASRAIADLRIIAPENGISPYVTVSIGVCCAWLKSVEEVWDLIDATDEALYAAKENGRNRIECTTYVPKRRKQNRESGIAYTNSEQ